MSDLKAPTYKEQQPPSGNVDPTFFSTPKTDIPRRSVLYGPTCRPVGRAFMVRHAFFRELTFQTLVVHMPDVGPEGTDLRRSQATRTRFQIRPHHVAAGALQAHQQRVIGLRTAKAGFQVVLHLRQQMRGHLGIGHGPVGAA